jgi:5-methylcytosine-specific restriction endonuclease McrA
VDESPRLSEDGISIEVKCRYCGMYFLPTNQQISDRIKSLESNVSENSLYCSKYCKQACPIFGRVKYPKGFKKATSREVQPELRQLVLERDKWTCQKCGKTTDETELHCHHILPINESPIESADVGNCIILCKHCHKEVHKLPDCRYNELKCSEE